jgi:chromosomal replication initiator protein
MSQFCDVHGNRLVQRRVTEAKKSAPHHHSLNWSDMIWRTANIAFPRQVAMYLARRDTKVSLHEIGETFGGRDHGTVLHACKTVSVRMKKEDQVRQAIVRLDTQLER